MCVDFERAKILTNPKKKHSTQGGRGQRSVGSRRRRYCVILSDGFDSLAFPRVFFFFFIKVSFNFPAPTETTFIFLATFSGSHLHSSDDGQRASGRRVRRKRGRAQGGGEGSSSSTALETSFGHRHAGRCCRVLQCPRAWQGRR